MRYNLADKTYWFAELFNINTPFKVEIEQCHYDAANEEWRRVMDSKIAINTMHRDPFQFAFEDVLQRNYPMWRFQVLTDQGCRYRIYRIGLDGRVTVWLVQMEAKQHNRMLRYWNYTQMRDEKYNFEEIPHEVDIQPLWEILNP